MKIDVDIQKPRPEITISHNGEELAFSANIYTRRAFSETDVYKEINQYFSELPEHTQDEIFEVYRVVEQGFDEVYNSDDLSHWLTGCICRLCDLIPLEDIRDWLVKNNLKIPSSVKDLPPNANDVINTADKTYTRPEYVDLIAMAVFFRTLTPIWGDYISSVRRETGVARKEFAGMMLLVDTPLMKCDAMNKLITYITRLTMPVHEDRSKFIENFSSEAIIFLYISLTCIRKICVADISGDEEVSSIVAVMFKFIQRCITSTDKSRIVEKENSTGDDSKHSMLESYRKRVELSGGEKAEITVMLSRPIRIAKYIQPDIPDDLLIKCMDTANILQYEDVSDVQLYLIGTMIKPVITPSSIFYVDSEIQAGLFGAMEAVLWWRGQKYLSVLLSSRLIQNVEEMLISNINSREQIPQDTRDELLKWYPYHYGYAKKSRENGGSEIYNILTSIDHMVDEFSDKSFRATASDERLIEVFGSTRRRVPIFSNIRQLLAEFLIDNERRIAAISKNPLEGTPFNY